MIATLERLFAKDPTIKDSIEPSDKALSTWKTCGPMDVRNMILSEQLCLGKDLQMMPGEENMYYKIAGVEVLNDYIYFGQLDD